MRSEWSPQLHSIMFKLDEFGRTDIADEIEKRLTQAPSASELWGEIGIYLIQLKKTEPAIFKKIEMDYDAFFKHFISQGLFIGMDY